MRFFKSLLPFLIFFFLINLQWGHCEDPVIINDHNNFRILRGNFIDHFEDPSNTLTIKEISSPLFQQKFQPGKKDVVAMTSNLNSTWWLRFTFFDSTQKEHVLFEIFDFRIDSFQIFVPFNNTFKIYEGGSKYPFEQRGFIHKNFVYDLAHQKNQPVTIFIKIKADEPVSFIGAIRSCDRLISYATTEYFLLALFYGIAAAMIMYNLFLFFVLRDKTYFFYILYVLNIALYTLCEDGLGFQYVWPEYPLLNDYMGPVTVYLTVACGLLYARNFLNTKITNPTIDKGIIAFLILRSVVFIAWIFYPSLGFLGWLDLLPFVFLYFSGLVSWISGYRTARFYVLAFTTFFAGFTVYMLQHYNIITPNPFTVYSLNLGILGEMILLSLALADRIKMLIHDKETAQKDTIEKLRENDWLKDQLNKELEKKVMERTREFDHFVYRSSHDIKGPLKSIIGLTSVGLKDVNDVVARKYFEHILKSSMRLDLAIDRLSKLMELREAELSISRIDFIYIINEVRTSFIHLPELKTLRIKINYVPEKNFYSDEKLIYFIFYNLFENALKFLDLKKKESFLEISIKVKDSYAYIVFKDNGVGIDTVSQEKVFDMFYKMNPDSPGPGLGLYMIKISIDRLSGTIRVSSKENEGTVMKLALKNYPQLTPELS